MDKLSNIKRRGFTLIEMVIVVVIIALLAAVALPKFIDISGDATTNVLKKISGDIQTALTLVEAKRQIDASSVEVDYAGETVPLDSGYPRANLGTLNLILDIKTPTTWTTYWNSNSQECTFDDFCMVGTLNINQAPSTPGFTNGNGVYIWPNGYILDSCFVYYVNPEDGTEPLVGSITDGC